MQVSPLPLPAIARLTITTGGEESDAGNITAPATVTIPAGMMSANFDITLAADATESSTGTVSISDAVFIHTDDMNITRTTDTLVIGGELFVLNIDSAANVFTLIVGDPSLFVDICDRTPQVEAAILADNGVTETACEIIPTTQLLTITELDLQSRNIPDLDTGDFANLSDLEVLNLDFNDLVSLPANVFDGLFRLQTLRLGVNDLESLPANVFDNLSNLTLLNLGTNELESLPAGLFDGLFFLEELFLDNNRLTPPLPAGLFNDVLGTLTTLTLNDQTNDADLRSTVSIEPSTAVIGSNAAQTFTARLTPPSPAIVRLTILAGGDEASRVTLPDPPTVTIPAGMASADFDITLAAEAAAGNTGTVAFSDPALIYTGTDGMEQSNTDVANRLVSISNTATFTVAAPSATYSPDDRTTAFEPISTTATATPTTFTLQLINLTSTQTNLAAQRTFFFNSRSNDFSAIGNVIYIPGYGTLPDGITAANWDNDFTLEYLPANGNPTANNKFIQDSGVYLRSDGGIPKTPSETYTFRVTPTHDGNDEGREHVVFGYRIFFSGQGDDQEQLRGVVDSDSAVTILERGDVILLRIRTFLEGALQ